jgi:MFS family permease
MTAFFQQFLRGFRSANPVPPEYRRTFLHLYLDIAWFGLLSGTTIAFIAVYATRQGADTQQIGLLTAAPALINLLFALPVGSWLGRRSIGRAVFWSSMIQRAFYLLLLPLPALLLPDAQVWVIIIMTLVMTVPGTVVNVGFNALFGEIVPLEWRGHVVGIRNALLSVVTTVFTLLSGYILNRADFPDGYQIVFALGVVGAGMSSLHLYYLSRFAGQRGVEPIGRSTSAASRRLSAEIRALYQRGVQSLRLDALHGYFARIMGLLFFWHLIQFMTVPIVTPYIVNELSMSDQTIGLAASFFNMTMFVGSLGLSRATVRFGNKRLTGFGIMGLSLFPILTALGAGGYVMANVVSGFTWAMAGGALYNYILENVPASDRPAHLAWYMVVSNAAILAGSLLGPLFAAQVGFGSALLIFGFARFLAGAAILRWG